jgi:hypothetical protein
VYRETVFLAGIPIDDKRVLTLAAKLRDAGLDDTAERLETAYDRETAVLALAIPARDEILQCSSTAPKDSASSEPCCSSSRRGAIAKGSDSGHWAAATASAWVSRADAVRTKAPFRDDWGTTCEIRCRLSSRRLRWQLLFWERLRWDTPRQT